MQGLRVPGSFIDQTYPGAALGDQYFRGSGTSEATAFASGAVALLLQKYPQATPDQVKGMLTASSDKLHSFNWKDAGSGELDLKTLLTASLPVSGAQYNLPSTGIGSLEASRGSDHLSLDGVVLQGETDIFGKPFNSASMAALEANGSSWSGGRWNGSSWSSGSSWSNLLWSGSSWSGSSWSGSSWSGSSWSGSSWSGSNWSSASWLGASW